MKNGERGAIAYLSSRQMDTLQKLMSLGVLPGSPIAIIQTFPSVVFQVGQTQVAVDADLAGDIYVRRTE
jgi:DtxR family Mn-dependent transcriptional regulator